jgi:hypothetical protein
MEPGLLSEFTPAKKAFFPDNITSYDKEAPVSNFWVHFSSKTW